MYCKIIPGDSLVSRALIHKNYSVESSQQKAHAKYLFSQISSWEKVMFCTTNCNYKKTRFGKRRPAELNITYFIGKNFVD